MRVLIADDEPLARQRIEDLLAEHRDVTLAGSVSNGYDALRAIRTSEVDLVFLDIQMPGLTGLEVVEMVGAERMPPAIFVTAFDQHAVRAFDLAAVDYLVKPFDDERFDAAFQRARKRIELDEVEQLREQLIALLQSDEAGELTGAPPSPDESKKWLERITVESRGESRVLPVAKIDYITASGPYAELHADGHVHLIRERMQNLEERLDPAHFFRVHRSAIVRISKVDAFLRSPGGDYAVRMHDGAELSVSRARRDELERRMGIG